jgi:hypothetical protein
MMNAKQERQLARHMLAHRAKGYSVGYVIRQSVWRYLILLVLAAGTLLASFAAEDRVLRLFFILGFGMFAGAILRDAGWIRRIKKNWPFSQKITDWRTVEAIAKGEDCQPTGPRDGVPAAHDS